MNGKEVFSFAVSKVPEAVKELLSREQVSCEDISYYLLHQANERIIRLQQGGWAKTFPSSL
mgnify:FL=1